MSSGVRRGDALERPETGALAERFRAVRGRTLALCEPLRVEDTVVQTMPDVSPTKWHLAHVTWFFERFVLRDLAPGYREFDARFDYLFNSYYETVGRMHPRAERGLLTRPTLDEVRAYRRHVDRAVEALLDRGDASPEVERRVVLGLHHEQQHQELLLMDVKHVLGSNPLRPPYRADLPAARAREPRPLGWRAFPGGEVSIGRDPAEPGFAFDNETPRHCTRIMPFELADRPVTCGEWRAFVEDDGYHRPELWLADGFARVRAEGWEAPLYWARDPGGRFVRYALGGVGPAPDDEPVVHVSYYEADAFARWAGARLPSEAEWELAAADLPVAGNFVESGVLHPTPAAGAATQTFGDVWEWTASAYHPYPGFRPLPGSLGEYNGKFMCSQLVLRGGACVTPRDHVRPTYRNFFYPHQRWAFAGLRLARDAG